MPFAFESGHREWKYLGLIYYRCYFCNKKVTVIKSKKKKKTLDAQSARFYLAQNHFNYSFGEALAYRSGIMLRP